MGNIVVLNLWGHLKDGVLKACKEVCGDKRGKRNKGGTWWRKQEVKESTSRKMHTRRYVGIALRRIRRGIKSMKNKAKKTDLNTMREKA